MLRHLLLGRLEDHLVHTYTHQMAKHSIHKNKKSRTPFLGRLRAGDHSKCLGCGRVLRQTLAQSGQSTLYGISKGVKKNTKKAGPLFSLVCGRRHSKGFDVALRCPSCKPKVPEHSIRPSKRPQKFTKRGAGQRKLCRNV